MGCPCCRGIGFSRREFLRAIAGGAGLAASGALSLEGVGSLLSAAEAAAPSDVKRILDGIILEFAATKENPWALLHGVRAKGERFSVQGISGFEYLCSQYLQEKSVNGKAYLAMPIEVEGHTNAFLSEAALDAGITSSHPFRWHDRQRTVGDLVAGAKALFAFNPASFDRNDLAWSLIVFAHTAPPKQDTWVNAYGKTVRFADVVEFGMVTLEDASKHLMAAKQKGTMPASKDWIHNFTCGGTHLIYGLMTCLRSGYRQNRFADRMKDQYDLLIWRLKADRSLMDRFFQEAMKQSPPDLVQVHRSSAMLKFLGHASEVVQYARLYQLFRPTAAQERAIRDGEEALAAVIQGIGRVGVGKMAAGNKELLNLFVGDACHAYHGLWMRKGVNQA